ncbi:hypothetical protein [Paraliomyxa miuraensis]|uniref:hypothetical protein n=1 Tax=Paraliomyxa miuraensis TaxID=376150 RepID=UPI002251D121|nr:hypothetical protein [Paraliomyxa miuraensis]MCX4248030.1 hypothetical protein [Paraliomyxa miuraensis]
MKLSMPWVGLVTATMLTVLTVTHIQLNLGGFGDGEGFVRGKMVRGELEVGHLPVT